MLIIGVSQGTVMPRLHNISIKYAFFLRFLHECTWCHSSLFSQNKQYGASDPWSDLTSGTNAGFKNLPPAFSHRGPSRLDLVRSVRVTVPLATGRHSLIRVTNGASPFPSWLHYLFLQTVSSSSTVFAGTQALMFNSPRVHFFPMLPTPTLNYEAFMLKLANHSEHLCDAGRWYQSRFADGECKPQERRELMELMS